eukprot:gene2290-2600_t
MQAKTDNPTLAVDKRALSKDHPYCSTHFAACELGKLTREYESEAVRVEEHLHLCGVRKELLSSKSRLHLQLIAGLASVLQLAHTASHMILAAWAALIVQHGKATALKFKLQQGVDALVHQRQAAQAKLKTLQLVMHDVQVKVQALTVQVQDEARQMQAQQAKSTQYSREIVQMRQELASIGFSQEITHAALLDKHAQVMQLQQRQAELQSKLDSYHHLPASKLGAEMMLKQAQSRLREKQAKLQVLLADMS